MSEHTIQDRTNAHGLAILKKRIEILEATLGTLIAWMVSSANSPIRPDEGTKLLAMLEGDK